MDIVQNVLIQETASTVVMANMAKKRLNRQILEVCRKMLSSADLYLARQSADLTTDEIHSTKIESTDGPLRETCSTEARRNSIESEALPKGMAITPQGFAAEGPAIISLI